MTLSSRHRIRNSSPGGLRPSTLPLGHGGSPQYWLSHVDGEETFFFVSLTAETGNRTPNSGVKGSGANHYPKAPALAWLRRFNITTKDNLCKIYPGSHCNVLIGYSLTNVSDSLFCIVKEELTMPEYNCCFIDIDMCILCLASNQETFV